MDASLYKKLTAHCSGDRLLSVSSARLSLMAISHSLVCWSRTSPCMIILAGSRLETRLVPSGSPTDSVTPDPEFPLRVGQPPDLPTHGSWPDPLGYPRADISGGNNAVLAVPQQLCDGRLAGEGAHPRCFWGRSCVFALGQSFLLLGELVMPLHDA